ncbi:MAG: hypothetical protein E7H54_04460 [Clostridium perfringens]|nr:hypothetical protein [Clostridium perfringens]
MAMKKKIQNNILLTHSIPSKEIFFDEDTVMARLQLKDYKYMEGHAVRQRDLKVFRIKESPAYSTESYIYKDGNRYVGLTAYSENETIQINLGNVDEFLFTINPKNYMLSKLGTVHVTKIGRNPRENAYAIVRFPVGDLHGAIPYPELSPSPELFKKRKSNLITHEEFLREFDEELPAYRLWAFIEKLKNQRDTYICCYEDDYMDCHRWVVGERLKKLGVRVIYE